MLYSFHKDVNAKGKYSVHATYTIIGKRPPMRSEYENGAHDDEDVDMDDGLLQSSAPERATQKEERGEGGKPVTAIVLAQEEDLDGEPHRNRAAFDLCRSLTISQLLWKRLKW